MKLVYGLGLGACLALVSLAVQRDASACGGLFCDGGTPQPMPVDQTGEDVLFAVDGDSVEAHVRIQYIGDAENFAWVIPMMTVPADFRVGSDALFEAVKNATVPTYSFTVQQDQCARFGNTSQAGGAPFSEDDDDGDDGDDGGKGPDVTVLAQETVGAFEIAVLTGGSAQEVADWLDQNGYAQDPEAIPILDEYLAENHVFAAIKLQAGAAVQEIHPVVFAFDHSEPCVPLRLTRIAAQDDLEMRVFYLGDARAVPQTYRHVLINEVMIDWANLASNYRQVISAAADAEYADGRAFVTEYAGPASVVRNDGTIFSDSWNPSAFEGLPPQRVIDTLETQGLYSCDEFDPCGGIHPMVDGLLARYLPVPEGLQLDEFYGNLDLYAEMIDLDAWEGGGGFAQEMLDRIVDPGLRGVTLLETFPYLTRMYTLISPNEMISDPIFHQNPDLPDVTNIRQATRRILCTGDSLWKLPDGREIFVPQGDPWPVIDEMPSVEEVQEVPPFGAPMTLANHSAAIDEAVAGWNAEHGYGDEDSGCGCRQGTGWSGLLLPLFGLVLARRRR